MPEDPLNLKSTFYRVAYDLHKIVHMKYGPQSRPPTTWHARMRGKCSVKASRENDTKVKLRARVVLEYKRYHTQVVANVILG